MSTAQKAEQEFVKLSIAANAAIQDINVDEINSLDSVEHAKTLLAAYREKINEVGLNMSGMDKETDKLALEKLLDEQRKELGRLNGMLRKKNLSIQISNENRKKQELMGSVDASGVRRRIQDKKSAAKANSAITDSLVSTSRLMAEHLQKSNETIATLSNSSKDITSTSEELKSMQGHIKNSHTLLTKYSRRETTDKLFIFLAMVFFLATVLYIMKKRLWSSAGAYSSLPQHSSDTVII